MENFITHENIGEFADRICRDIVKHASGSPNNGPWTTAVYQALRDEAKERSWRLYPEEKPKKGEYLCDFMLFEKGYGCRVACESQWWWDTDPLDGLAWAFDKLCGVKSDLKLFIFEGKEGHIETLIAEYLEKDLQLNEGEAFLALRWVKDHFENAFWIAPHSGVQPSGSVILTPLRRVHVKTDDFVTDHHGNNSAVRCPKCLNPFIISALLEAKRTRRCPHCDGSIAGFREGVPFINEAQTA